MRKLRARVGGAVLLVLALVGAAAPSTAAPGTVGAEQALAPRGSRPDSVGQAETVVAFDGQNFLAAWTLRYGPDRGVGLRLGLVSPAGKALAVATDVPAHEQAVSPALAFDGTNFLLVWQEQRFVDTPTSHYETSIWSVRVARTGKLLGSPIQLASTGTPVDPAVAYDGAAWTVVWSATGAAGPDIVGRRVGATGLPTGSQYSISRTQDGGGGASPAIARRTSGSFVAWVGAKFPANGPILGARLGSTGAVLDASPIVIADNDPSRWRKDPSVAAASSNLLVTWEEVLGGVGTTRIQGTRVSKSGVVAVPGGRKFTDDANTQEHGVVASDGTGWLLAFEDRANAQYDVRTVKIDATGKPSGPVLTFGEPRDQQWHPSLAFGGGAFLAVWQDDDAAQLVGARLAPPGTVIGTPGFPVALTAGDQFVQAIASDGVNHLGVWTDTYSGPRRLIVGRVQADGSRPDGTGTRIKGQSFEGRPAVVFDGQNYLVVWRATADPGDGHYDDDLLAVRVSTAGVVLDAQSIPVATGPETVSDPHVSPDPGGQTSLVVYSASPPNDWTPEGLKGVRVRWSGQVVDTTPISIATGHVPSDVDATFNGTDHVVVWARTAPFESTIVRSTRVTRTGAVRDPIGLDVTAAGPFGRIAAASNGTSTLVVYSKLGDAPDSGDYAIRVNGSGTTVGSARRLGPVAIALDVAANGSYLVTRQPQGTGPSFGLVGTLIGADGSVVDTGTQLASGEFLGSAAVARSRGKDFIVAYQRRAGTGTAGFVRRYAPA